jgi:hypothetical protein
VIDFRYHIVSLISVFLALAVGIALGAGPLKETIGDSLTGQVSQLRDEKEALRSQLDTADKTAAQTDAYIDASAGQLLSGRLADRRVAVVVLGDVPAQVRDGIDARLKQAGATVSAHVSLTNTWTDASQRSYRQALVANLTSYLDPAPATDATTEDELAAALVQGLAGADPAAPNQPSDSASILLELLTTGDNPLAKVEAKVTAPADAIVLIAPPLTETTNKAAATPATESEQTARLALVAAAQSRSSGAVLVDGSRGAGSLIDAVLADGTLKSQISTVSGMSATSAQVNVPLALAARIAGQVGHFGFGDQETAIPAAVTLPPVDRSVKPATPAAPGAGG